MKTIDYILRYVSQLNTERVYNSAVGYRETECSKVASDTVRREISKCLPVDSLAKKILDSTDVFSQKQLYVIASQIEKNEDFSVKIAEMYASIERAENAKIMQSKAKLAANKATSQSILDYVKSNGFLLKDFYSFAKKNSPKEFYSKKFSMGTAEKFINLKK